MLPRCQKAPQDWGAKKPRPPPPQPSAVRETCPRPKYPVTKEAPEVRSGSAVNTAARYHDFRQLLRFGFPRLLRIRFYLLHPPPQRVPSTEPELAVSKI